MGQPILSSSRAYFNVVTIHGYGIGGYKTIKAARFDQYVQNGEAIRIEEYKLTGRGAHTMPRLVKNHSLEACE